MTRSALAVTEYTGDAPERIDALGPLPTARPSDSPLVAVRVAFPKDADALWALLEPVFRAGETVPLVRTITRKDALRYWRDPTHHTYVAETDGQVVGSYVLRSNLGGGASHIASCAYVSAPGSLGDTVLRNMVEHSLSRSRERGFRAMRFDFVVAGDARIPLWQQHGFGIVGRVPAAFYHPTKGYVDALVMHRAL